MGYDAASRISFIAEATNPPNVNTYDYDALDRLTSATLPLTSYGYTYDAVGNRQTRIAGASTDTYAYSATSNRLASITPPSGPIRSFSFDPNGSTTADGNNTYAYDVRGRMVSATSSLGTTTYRVNALGQRVRKTNSLSDRVFHHDDRGHLIAESTAAGAILKEYVWLGDTALAVIDSAAYRYIHVDHLNTPRLVANAQGQTAWRWDQQEPFGNNLADQNPSGLGTFEFPLRFIGTYSDLESNLLYNWHRYLEPARGQYLQSDPIGLKGGSLSTYVHVGNNPLQNIDPDGLKLWLCIRSCCGGVANHAYLYDDDTGKCCGDPGPTIRERDYIKSCKERGPGTDACWMISSTPGDAEKALNCCNREARGTFYIPGYDDCQDRADDCIRQLGMAPPNTPSERRFMRCNSCFRK